MKALIHNCTTDEHIIKDFLNESEIRAFQETLKMADRETNFNIYYNEATAATPKKHIVDAGKGFKCTSVCYDITWSYMDVRTGCIRYENCITGYGPVHINGNICHSFI